MEKQKTLILETMVPSFRPTLVPWIKSCLPTVVHRNVSFLLRFCRLVKPRGLVARRPDSTDPQLLLKPLGVSRDCLGIRFPAVFLGSVGTRDWCGRRIFSSRAEARAWLQAFEERARLGIHHLVRFLGAGSTRAYFVVAHIRDQTVQAHSETGLQFQLDTTSR